MSNEFKSKGATYHFYIINDDLGLVTGRLYNKQVITTNRDFVLFEYLDEYLDEMKKIDADFDKKLKKDENKYVYFLHDYELDFLNGIKTKKEYRLKKDGYDKEEKEPKPIAIGSTQSMM